MHLVLRSARARGELSLLRPRNVARVHALLDAQAKRHHMKIFEYVNMGNHLHIKLRCFSRESFQAFLKSFTAMAARKVTGARKGRAFGKFWDGLAFTRMVGSRFEERVLGKYFIANEYERELVKAVREIFLGGDELIERTGYRNLRPG